jgi:hypothetical protein
VQTVAGALRLRYPDPVRHPLLFGLGLGVTFALTQGCGSSDSASTGANGASTGGSSGAGGSSGSTAAGGSSGSGGSSTGRSGASGSTGGASGGSGGSGGTASGGTSGGTGGTSGGTGGTSGGTSGGTGGTAPADGGNADAGKPDAGCPAGYAECDKNPQTVCEQSLNDVASCGACGHACSQQNGTVTCENQICKVASCTGAFGDCDGKGDNGCETSLTRDKSCGSCGRDCTIDGATCSSGLCGSVQLFSATDMPFGTDNSGARSWAFDPTTASAFWVGFNSYSVRRYPFDGSAASLVWQPATATTAGTESIAVTGGNVYWSIGGSPPTVFKKAVGAAAATNPTQAFFPAARASFLRVQGSSFYWVSGDYQDPTPEPPTHVGYVYTRAISAPQSDGGTAIVTVDQGNFGDFQAFQPTSDALYWITRVAGTGVAFEIRTTPLTGGTPTVVPKVAGATDTAVAVAYGTLPTLYAAGATLYFTRDVGTSSLNGIYRYAKGDTAPTALVTAENVTSLLVDGQSIYFLQQNANGVFKAPLAGGAAVQITGASGYKLIGQDATYLYLLQSASGTSTLAKVIK